MNYDTTTAGTQPLTYEDLQRALKMLVEVEPPPPNIVFMSRKDFDFTMIMAKYYQGKQIVRRNYNAHKKSNRYRKTWIAPHFIIVDENCLMQYGIKFMPMKS